MTRDSGDVERSDETSQEPSGAEVELAAAIEALRSTLVRAAWDGESKRVRFRLEPVELTVQVGVTRTGKGSAGISWHVLSLGAEKSKQAVTTQTLTLRLTPVLFDEHGQPLADGDQLVDDAENRPAGGSDVDVSVGEPE